YNDFIRSYPNDPAADDARLNLARLYEKSNQPTAAIDLLSKMTNAAAFTPVGSEVQDRLKSLFTKYPALAPKPATAPAPSAQTPLMLQNLQRPPTVTPAPNPAPAAPQSSAPSAPPKIVLPNPGQNTQPGK